MLRVSGSDPMMGAPLLCRPSRRWSWVARRRRAESGPHRTLLDVLVITMLQNGIDVADVNALLQDVVLEPA
jgi:hypothetical protein